MALLIVLAMASVVHGQATFDNRWYVDESATGLNDGTSWANAFTDLQDALAAAKVIEEETDEIWVAAGIYYPTQGTDRSVSFYLLDDVSRYGGFLGNAPGGGETERSQRDLESNKTILSGDIGTVDDPSDNSLHLVRASDVGPSAAINGFTVTRAYLDSGEVGGGLYILDANSVITRCLFEDNEVIGNAGAAPPDFRSTRV